MVCCHNSGHVSSLVITAADIEPCLYQDVACHYILVRSIMIIILLSHNIGLYKYNVHI